MPKLKLKNLVCSSMSKDIRYDNLISFSGYNEEGPNKSDYFYLKVVNCTPDVKISMGEKFKEILIVRDLDLKLIKGSKLVMTSMRLIDVDYTDSSGKCYDFANKGYGCGEAVSELSLSTDAKTILFKDEEVYEAFEGCWNIILK